MEELNKELMKELAILKKKLAAKNLDLYFENVLKKILPHSYFKNFTDEFIEGVHMINGCKITLPPYNHMLRGSKYYYNKPLKFIHYTSLDNCLNILREKSFRMYNLNCLDDKLELIFASQKMFPQLDEHAKEYWKSNIFSFSMCEYQLEETESSFDVWRNYAQDGMGVGIVLKFNKKNQRQWMNRYLSKIQYQEKSLENFIQNHNDFTKETYYHIIGNHQELLLNLCCFHKNKIYKNEREVRYIEIENGFDKPNADDIRLSLSIPNNHNIDRMLFRRDFDAWEKYKTKFDNTINVDLSSDLDLGKDKKRAYFRRLYLDDEFRNILFEQTVDCPFTKKYMNEFLPSIKIEKVILGYRHKKEGLVDIRNIISEIAEKKLGYPIEVELSKLKSYF